MSVTDTEHEFNPLELAQQHAAEQDLLLENVEIRQGTNLVIEKGQLNEFVGSMPIYDLSKPAGYGPVSYVEGIPCAWDLRGEKAEIKITEAHGFRQARGGQEVAQAAIERGEEPDWMWNVEIVFAVLGSKLGFMMDGEFVAHPAYERAKLQFVTSRAFEVYTKSPFRTPEKSVEELRMLLLDYNFQVANFGVPDDQRQTKRDEKFHIVAQEPTTGNPRAKIVARQKSGFPIDQFTLTAPRPVETRPIPQGASQPRPEFEDFMRSFEENLHRVTVALATEESMSQAGRLSSAITGLDEERQYPLRATVASIAWRKEKMGPPGYEDHEIPFFPDTNSDGAEAEEANQVA